MKNLLYIRFTGHDPERSFFGGDKIGRRIGKSEHIGQGCFGAIVETVIQHIVQHAGTEGVARAGRFDRAAEQKCGHIDARFFIVAIAAVGASGHVQHADVRKPSF